MAQEKYKRPTHTVENVKMDTTNTAFMKDIDVDNLTSLAVTGFTGLLKGDDRC